MNIEEKYMPDIQDGDVSFLSRSFERHFNERPFLNHTCYLFLTKTTKERSRTQSNFNALTRRFIVPKEVQDQEMVAKFLESCDQYLCFHTLSDTEDLPGSVKSNFRYEKLCTDRSDCRLCFAAPVGVLLSCNHLFNQYLFIDDGVENLKRFEKQARNMHSLSRYSRSNQINREWIEPYLNEAHSQGLTSIRAHFNVMAWSDDREELKRIKNDVGSQLALMECKPRHNTFDTPALFWAGIPGNEADFPAEESFYTFFEQVLCFFIQETNYKNSVSPFGIKMVDRLTGKPLHLNISDLKKKSKIRIIIGKGEKCKKTG